MDYIREALSRREKKKLQRYVEDAAENRPLPEDPDQRALMDELIAGNPEKSIMHWPDTGRAMKPFDMLDSVSGAPLRRGLAELMAGQDGQPKKVIDQVAKDPETAPTWEDLAGQAGIENEYGKKAVGLLGSFLEPSPPGVGLAAGIVMKNPKLAKKFDSLADNEKLAEKIGTAKKVGETEIGGGYGSKFKAEIFETDSGHKRAVARDEDGNIVGSVILKPDGSIASATAQRAEGQRDPEWIVEELHDHLKEDANGWTRRRELREKTIKRAELKELPTDRPEGISAETRLAKMHQDPDDVVVEQRRGEFFKDVPKRLRKENRDARRSKLQAEEDAAQKESHARIGKRLQGEVDDILKDPETKRVADFDERFEFDYPFKVNVFETTNPEMRNQIGIHLTNPSKERIDQAFEQAFADGYDHVFIHRPRSADVVPFPKKVDGPIQNPDPSAIQVGRKMPKAKPGRFNLAADPEIEGIFPKLRDRFGAGQAKDLEKGLAQAAKSSDPYVVTSFTAMPLPNPNPKMDGIIGRPGIQESTRMNRKYLDPFMWMDSKYGFTKKMLDEYNAIGKPITINTSSDLIGRDDYIRNIPPGSTVNLYKLTPNDRVNRLLFPANPSNQRIGAAAQKLKDAGVKVKEHTPSIADLESYFKNHGVSDKEIQGIVGYDDWRSMLREEGMAETRPRSADDLDIDPFGQKAKSKRVRPKRPNEVDDE